MTNPPENLDFFMTFSMEVKLIRMIGNTLVPSHLHVVASIDRNEGVGDYDLEVGIAKCRYWLEHIVSKTIAFHKENDVAIDAFTDSETRMTRVANMFMITPDEPRDEMLGTLFQAKMNALSSGAFTVVTINVESDNLNGLSFTLAGDHGVFLPQTMEEWLGAPSYFDVPWWMRDDRSTLDVYLLDENDRHQPPAWAASLDFLDKRTKKVEENVQIIRPEFKPTVIKGGKDDEDDK